MAIGAVSAKRAKKTSGDYLLASREVSPWLVALSAVATNNSGYMFIGQIGFTYYYGLSSVWLMLGWIVGDFLSSLFVHEKLRNHSAENNFYSFGGLLSGWHGPRFRYLQLLVGSIVVIFLGTYAAAQFKAGSKALHVLFGWDYSVGAVLGALVVLLYCFSGGIRASIWTDAAQSFVMIFAMAGLLAAGVHSLGGFGLTAERLAAVSEGYMSVWPEHVGDTPLPLLLWIVGWLFGGIAIVGMPHVMIRFMAMKETGCMRRVRCYYYTWYVFFYACSIGVGLLSRVILPESSSFDAELALPSLAIELLPPVFVGVVLAGLFSATMSTADSLILSCSASITRDILPVEKASLGLTKASTLAMAVIALLIALYGSSNVFNLVLISVSVLASSFCPLLFLYVFDIRVRESTAILMMIVGSTTAILWKHFGLSSSIYEVAPGIISGLLVYAVCRGVRGSLGKS